MPLKTSTENLHWDWYSRRGHFSSTSAIRTSRIIEHH